MWFRYGRFRLILPLIGVGLSAPLLLGSGPFQLPYGLVLEGFAAIIATSVAGLLVLAGSLLLGVRGLSWFGVLDNHLTWMVLGLQQRLKAHGIVEVERVRVRRMHRRWATRVTIRGQRGTWKVTDGLLEFDEFCRELSLFCTRHGIPIYDRRNAARRGTRARIPSL